jgi:hypothetical protein
MRNILFVLVLSLSHIVFADGSINIQTKPGRYEVFNFIPVEAAKNRAEVLAKEDYKLKNYRYLIYGLREEDRSYGGYLEDRYGIEDRRVAYCVVSDSIIQAANTYNQTMRELLAGKYGRDIFKEAEGMSRRAEKDNSSLN